MTATESLSLASRVCANDDILFQALQDESVLLNLNSGIYFGLDPIGTRIWQLLAEHQLVAELADAITAEYDVAEDRCVADLFALVAELQRQGLVIVT